MFLTTVPKNCFTKNPKTIKNLKTRIVCEKLLPLKCFCGHVGCSFHNPEGNFIASIRKVLAQNRKKPYNFEISPKNPSK